MGIYFSEEQQAFQLDTQHTTYLIGLTREGYVGHAYYGKRLHHLCGLSNLRLQESPFSPSVNEREKVGFLNSFPQEYPTGGMGDTRESALEIRNASGQRGAELRYETYRIEKGKPKLQGLPASFGSADEVETLFLVLKDEVLQLRVVLQYSVFEQEDVITRNACIVNEGNETISLEKAYSASLDMDNRDFERISLVGNWARERQIQRTPVAYGKQLVSSERGETSHQAQPFLALVTRETTQEAGEVYAMHLVYSGNFIAQVGQSEYDSLRLSIGINPVDFNWKLETGMQFQTPEAVLVYSSEGLTGMTHRLHDFYRNHLIRSKYLHEMRPVLINNWEATFFDFDAEKLLTLAKKAKECGIEMLVMDDGWFGHRNSDQSSLGDWYVNEKKFPDGFDSFVQQIKRLGLKFGIWFEPEMISPDSDLYRAHPDWAIQIQGRIPSQSRQQYVLDLSREEVRNYAYEAVATILRSTSIDYVKWDMNRQLCDLGSMTLPAHKQGELFHRYVLGVYEIQERLVSEFPDLLLENCSGGGARFDPGMLFYSPQIWCSDNNDAIDRLHIQEGTALIYPLSTMGAHVGASPYPMVGRATPMQTRGNVALAGTFGYELDITAMPEEERNQIQKQVALYHKYHGLISEGDYYRIHSWNEKAPYDCYHVVSKDKKEVLLNYVQVLGKVNMKSRMIRFQGLLPAGVYELEESGQRYYGEELMQIGLPIDNQPGDFISKLYHLTLVREERFTLNPKVPNSFPSRK